MSDESWRDEKWKKKQIFVVKYALTKGIWRMQAEVSTHGYAKKGMLWLSRKDWAETEETAMLMAEDLRKKRIQSLERQLKRLKELKIKVSESKQR